jgi:hypothetical protein
VLTAILERDPWSCGERTRRIGDPDLAGLRGGGDARRLVHGDATGAFRCQLDFTNVNANAKWDAVFGGDCPNRNGAIERSRLISSS